MHGYWVFNGVVTYVSNWLGYVKGKVQQKIMGKKDKNEAINFFQGKVGGKACSL